MDEFVKDPGKIGVIGILLGWLWAWMNGKVYSGKSYDNLMEEKNALRKIVDESNSRDRAKLDRLEAKLDEALQPRKSP